MKSDGLASTRVAFHSVCEQVLAAALYQATGHIGLLVVGDGFATPPFGADGRVISLSAGHIAVTDRLGTHSERLTTVRAAAAYVGIEPAAPAEVYRPSTVFEPDAELSIVPGAAEDIIGWYVGVSAALRAFAPDSQQTLWPEHFDVAIRRDGCNFGGLAGDAAISEPYVYVGPPAVPPGDPFFTQPFGAARTWEQTSSVTQISAFFGDGARRAREVS